MEEENKIKKAIDKILDEDKKGPSDEEIVEMMRWNKWKNSKLVKWKMI